MCQILLAGCLKTRLKNYSEPGRNHTVEASGQTVTVPNCTSPWHQSLLDEQYYDEDISTVCNRSDLNTLYLLDYDFSQGGANMNETKTGCRGKCVQVISKSFTFIYFKIILIILMKWLFYNFFI